MAKEIAVGIVIGGAVSATLGQAVGKTSQSLAMLQKSLADSSGIRNLIGETQRLQREMAEADKAGRRLGLEGVRKLRGEVGKLETDWKNATREVANLAGQLAQAKATGQSGLLPGLEQEYQALRQAARQTAELSGQRRQAWQQARAGGQATAEEIRALKQQADAARLASKESRQLMQAKRQQRDAARQTMDAEQALTQAFNKARDAASQAKRAFEDKRRTLHDTRNSLNSTAVVIGSTVSQTVRLGDAIRQTATVGSTLRQSLDLNIGKLREMGVEVGNLDKALHQLQQKEKGMQWQQQGLGQIQSGLAMGKQAGAMVIGASVLPTTSAANYQSIIRDIAIKDGVAGTVKEQEMKEQVIQSAQLSGMNVNEMAQGINMLVEKGMKVDEALKLGPLLSKFIVGQAADAADVASMMFAIRETAGVKNNKDMTQALETIAFHGKDGSFEAKNMAKAFPGLLAMMADKQILGNDSVNQLGAMLQIQMKATASPEEAANNLRNWISKISSPETVAGYEKAGLKSYQKNLEDYIASGMSTLEASMQMAKDFIEHVDPAEAKKMREKAATFAKITDDEQRVAQIKAFKKSLKAGGIFHDMQVNMALTAYMQNSDEYRQRKKDGAKASGQIDQDLADRRETSQRKWAEVANDFNLAMIRIGDAIRPVTDMAAELASISLKLGGDVIKENPSLALAGGAVAGGMGLIAAKRVIGGTAKWLGGKALAGIAGRLPGGKPAGSGLPGSLATAGAASNSIFDRAIGAQRVFVTNWPGGGLSIGDTAPGRNKSAVRVGGVVRQVIGNTATAGRAALIAPTMGTLAGASAGTIAAAGGMVAASGAAGYAVGSVLNAGISKGLSAASGSQTTLGSWLYDFFNKDADNKALGKMEYKLPAKATPVDKAGSSKAAASQPAQQFTFAPKIEVKVMGDAKHPAEIATQLAPHLKKLFDEWSRQQRNPGSQLYDPVG